MRHRVLGRVQVAAQAHLERVLPGLGVEFGDVGVALSEPVGGHVVVQPVDLPVLFGHSIHEPGD
jgi:hypothetical protein